MTDNNSPVDTEADVEEEPTEEELAEQLRGHWAKVEEVLPLAKSMHFDGCHKIYLSMDDTEHELMSGHDSYLTVAPDLDTIRGWYESSCVLRLINAVYTNEDDPNAGFVQLIPQGF